MKLYIAGPMTGLPEYNYPAFHAAAAELRAAGHEVVSPAEGWEHITDPAAVSWQDYMRSGLSKLLHCEAVALLPGWAGSRGASLEVRVAEALGMPTRLVAEWVAR